MAADEEQSINAPYHAAGTRMTLDTSAGFLKLAAG